MTTSTRPTVDETSARQVLLLRAFEDDPQGHPLWTADDKAWATRLARASDPGPAVAASGGSRATTAAAVRFICDRARHAQERLRPRHAAAARFIDARFSLTPWLLAALLLGLAAGVAVDQIGPSQRINLLAAPIGLLVLWNLAVYLAIALRALLPGGWWPGRGDGSRRGLRQRLPSLWLPRLDGPGPLQRLAADWARASAPLNGARVALLLHAAAAALALGVVAGLYARGLVLDYRAGWQSTFLEPAAVQGLLATVLAPASAVTGIAVPGVDALAALRVVPDRPAQGPAAPWLHLFATTLALFVIGPRLLLAALAAGRVLWLSRHWALPWQDPYFQGLQRAAAARPLRVWVLPHAAPLAAGPALNLQALVAAANGGDTPLRVADPVGLGNEDDSARCTPPADTTLALVQVDMAGTPEAESQGRLLATLQAATVGSPCQLVLLLDEAAFNARFAALPQRLQQRRLAWQQLADRHAVPLLAVDLSQQPPEPERVRALQHLLGA